MRMAGRIAAAIEILTDVFTQHRPASEALKDMLVSEIDLIRDALVIVNMFLGEPILVGVKYLQEFE